MDIKGLNESAKKVHGPDIMVLVARAVAFGHDDNLIMVRGRRREQAARDIAQSVVRQGNKPTIRRQQRWTTIHFV